MTTAKDLSGTWSVAAFYRAIADAHLDLEHLSNDAQEHLRARPHGVWGAARGVAGGLRAAARPRDDRVMDWRDTPHYRDTFVTDAQGSHRLPRRLGRPPRLDGGAGHRGGARRPAGGAEAAPRGRSSPMPTLTERLGPDRMEAFVTKLRQEGPEPEKASGWAVEAPDLRWTFIGLYVGQAAELGRYAGLKYENVALLEQARRDEAVARAAWKRVQELRPEWCREWLDAPPAPDDPARE